VAGAATMEYDGMIWEVVASGIKAGNNGSTTGAAPPLAPPPAGAADAFFLVFFGFFFDIAAAPAREPNANNAKSGHNQLAIKEPEEPDWLEPMLLPDAEPEFNEDCALSESDAKELEESPLEPEDESHGVIVVVRETKPVVAEAACKTTARTMARVDTMVTGRF